MQRTLADDRAGSTMSSSDLLAAIREFTTTILNPYDLEDLLHRLTEHASIVTGSRGAGVMLAGSDGLAFAATSDDQVIEIEVLQDRIASGACHRTYTSDELVIVDRLTAGTEWPDDVEGPEIITAMGAGYVLYATRLRAQHDLAGRLEAALGSRDVIGQAKGLAEEGAAPSPQERSVDAPEPTSARGPRSSFSSGTGSGLRPLVAVRPKMNMAAAR